MALYGHVQDFRHEEFHSVTRYGYNIIELGTTTWLQLTHNVSTVVVSHFLACSLSEFWVNLQSYWLCLHSCIAIAEPQISLYIQYTYLHCIRRMLF